MEKKEFELEFRDLGKERLSESELDQMIGERDYKEFLNPRNEIYRQKKLKENPPSRREAIRMMAEEPNLIRRPVIIVRGRIVVGFDEEAIAKL